MKRLCPETQRCGFEQEKKQSRYSSKVDLWQKSRGCWIERLNSYGAWLTVSKEESCLAKLLCRPCFAIILNPASDRASTHQLSGIKHQHRRHRRRGYLLSILGCRASLERWLTDVRTDRWARQDRPDVDDTPAGGESLQISDWDCWFCGFEDATSSRARRIPDSSLCVHHKQTARSLLFSPPGLGTTFKVPNLSSQRDNFLEDEFFLLCIWISLLNTLSYIESKRLRKIKAAKDNVKFS